MTQGAACPHFLKASAHELILVGMQFNIVINRFVDEIAAGPVLVGGKPVMDEKGKVLRYDHGDVAAQRIMHEAMGFLPTKKGGEVNINFGLGRPAEERDEDTDADEAWDEAFPPLGDEVKTWSADKHKLLEGGK